MNLSYEEKNVLKNIKFKKNKSCYLILNGLYKYDKLINETLEHVIVKSDNNIIIIKNIIKKNNKRVYAKNWS